MMPRIALAVTLIFAFGMAPSARAGVDPPTVCRAAARPANLNFTLRDISGQAVALKAFSGQVILLNFWATWCGPCHIEIPGFVELYKKYRSQGLAVLGVSTDDTVAKLKPFVADLKMNYPVLVGAGHDDLMKAYPGIGLPNTFIIGRDGIICEEHSGLAMKEQIEPLIKTLLTRK